MSTPEVADRDALMHTIAEIERHVAETGWDQPVRLYALVDTEELLAAEPQLARTIGILPGAGRPGSLTPVEQDDIGDAPLDELLAGIAWPDAVLGCALVHEVVILPPAAQEEAPDDDTVVTWAASHPERRDVRMAVGVLRDGSRACLLRLRSPATPGAAEDEDDLLTGPDLAPRLVEALLATLA